MNHKNDPLQNGIQQLLYIQNKKRQWLQSLAKYRAEIVDAQILKDEGKQYVSDAKPSYESASRVMEDMQFKRAWERALKSFQAGPITKRAFEPSFEPILPLSNTTYEYKGERSCVFGSSTSLEEAEKEEEEMRMLFNHTHKYNFYVKNETTTVTTADPTPPGGLWFEKEEKGPKPMLSIIIKRLDGVKRQWSIPRTW